jgi:hypothetical protein
MTDWVEQRFLDDHAISRKSGACWKALGIALEQAVASFEKCYEHTGTLTCKSPYNNQTVVTFVELDKSPAKREVHLIYYSDPDPRIEVESKMFDNRLKLSFGVDRIGEVSIHVENKSVTAEVCSRLLLESILFPVGYVRRKRPVDVLTQD